MSRVLYQMTNVGHSCVVCLQYTKHIFSALHSTVGRRLWGVFLPIIAPERGKGQKKFIAKQQKEIYGIGECFCAVDFQKTCMQRAPPACCGNYGLLIITIRVRLHYVTKPCDVSHMTV